MLCDTTWRGTNKAVMDGVGTYRTIVSTDLAANCASFEHSSIKLCYMVPR